MGGGDERSNLVPLSYGDHLFAHCVLARIHGGGMSVAAYLMMNAKTYRSSKVRRATFSRLRAEFVLQVRGASNGNHNPKEFHWVNADTGQEKTATLLEMGALFGARAHFTSVVAGVKATAAGWYLKGGKEVKTRSWKGKKFTFVNCDGRTFFGTSKQFCDLTGHAPSAATRIVKYRSVTKDGWRLIDTPERKHNEKAPG